MEHRIGAQTITWGSRNREDLPSVLTSLKELRYDGAEIGMRHFDASRPNEYRVLFEHTGVLPLGLHSGGQFWKPEAAETERRKLDESVQFAAAVGFSWLVVSGNKEETAESMREAAATYSRIGDRCKAAGIRFAYHNHDWELRNDAEILDTLVRATGPEVSLVLDIAWAHRGGIPVDSLLDRFGDRIAYLHVKDVAGERFCELGTGELNLDAILSRADRDGIEWVVVEQDYTDSSPEKSMAMNRSFLSDRGW